jgi:prepilin-type N-terminal cleavage/methylation domain-containing protein
MNRQVKKSGFTIIEMVVVISIMGLILPVFFTIIYTLIKQQTQILVLQRIKENGDFASRRVVSLVLNNAVSIDASCTSSELQDYLQNAESKICFEDSFGNPFTIYTDDQDRMASASAITGEVILIGNSADLDLTVTDATFAQTDPKSIRINFKVNFIPKTADLVSQSMVYRNYVYLRQ